MFRKPILTRAISGIHHSQEVAPLPRTEPSLPIAIASDQEAFPPYLHVRCALPIGGFRLRPCSGGQAPGRNSDTGFRCEATRPRWRSVGHTERVGCAGADPRHRPHANPSGRQAESQRQYCHLRGDRLHYLSDHPIPPQGPEASLRKGGSASHTASVRCQRSSGSWRVSMRQPLSGAWICQASTSIR